MIYSKNLRASVTVIIIYLFSCNTKIHTKDEIESAMRQYDHLIQKMDTDSIALLYTEDGDMGNVAHGRDSIRKFLETFKDYKVLSQSSTSRSVNIYDDSSLQTGIYKQVVTAPGKDILTVKGEYKVTRLWMPDKRWHIKHMETKSL